MRKLSWRRVVAVLAVAVGLSVVGAVPASAQPVSASHHVQPDWLDWWV